MVIEIISLLVFVGSFLGMILMINQKIPVLADLSPERTKKRNVFKKLKTKIRKTKYYSPLPSKKLLKVAVHKVKALSRGALKDSENLSKKTQKSAFKKKNNFSDDYWERLKKEK